MQIDIFSLFPDSMLPYLEASVVGKARQSSLVNIELHNIRDYAQDKHLTTDSEPYGGGGGMVLRPEPIFGAVEAVLDEQLEHTEIILLTPQGRLLDQRIAASLAQESRLALIAARYEGVDERVREHLVTDEISIGDYVLTGGELPALVLVDSVVRLIPGVLGNETSVREDSHTSGLLEGPHYTRPSSFRSWDVPEILRSGDHARIAAWRRQQALRRTSERRPELLEQAELSESDRAYLRNLGRKSA
jgi:tRNA (guanine37-N1)-methyltransferase